MKKNNKFADVLVMGLALFAIFFGAGNLIFPPRVGQVAGVEWKSAMAGFLTTDPILPVFGIIAAALIGGKAGALGKRVSPNFSKIMTIISMLIIGPLFAIPRTAATVHEIAVLPWFPNAPAFITSFIFLGVTFLFIIKEGGIIDIIGRYLTPILLLVLAVLIIKSIIQPIGVMAAPATEFIGFGGIYFSGFTEGYQTMDALGAILTIGILTNDMIRKGYHDQKERFHLSLGMAAVAGGLLLIVYGGLVYVGASASSVLPAGDYTRVGFLVEVAQLLLGKFGLAILGVCVTVACLTTSTGLTAMVAEFFGQEIFKDKVSYIVLTTSTIIVSFIISIFGTEKIIALAGPILSVIYPVIVVLIFFTLADNYIVYDQVYFGAAITTLVIAISYETANIFNTGIGQTVAEMIAKLPLANYGFPWLLPALLGAAVGSMVGRLMDKKKTA